MAGTDAVEDTASADQGFQNFKRILPENCIEYMLFIIEGDAPTKKILSGLETVRKAAAQLSKQLTRDYIWQRDDFNLTIKNEGGMDVPQSRVAQALHTTILIQPTRPALSSRHRRLR